MDADQIAAEAVAKARQAKELTGIERVRALEQAHAAIAELLNEAGTGWGPQPGARQSGSSQS